MTAYTAAYTMEDGTEYSDTQEVTTTKDHSYTGTATYNWSADGKTCKVTIQCANCTATETHDCTVTSKVKTAATTTAKGVTTYTAAYGSYTDSKDVEDIDIIVPDHTHSYVTTITKATNKKNGSIVKACECGDVKSTTVISYAKTVKLAATSYAYDGKAKKPAVTVYTADGKVLDSSNYKVTYSNNTAVGTATVTVTLKGKNYTGTLTKTFKITMPTVAVKTVAASGAKVKLTFKTNSAVTGYYIYKKTGSGKYIKYKTLTSNKATVTLTDSSEFTNGTQYTYAIKAYLKTSDGEKVTSSYGTAKSIVFLTKPAKPAVKNSASKAMTVTWAKNSKCTGYEIRYYVKGKDVSTAKTVKVTGAKTLSKKITKLSKGKTYSVQVRAYKTANKVTSYSDWSDVTNVKISK